MRYRTLFFVCFLFLSSVAVGQVTGYQNKRFILKTDVINFAVERGYNVSFEYAVFRRMSVGFEYRRVNRNYKQDLGYTMYEGTVPDDKAETMQNFWLLQFRFYKNSSFPAPKGAFTYINTGYGNYDVSGMTTRYVVDLFEEGYQLVNYKAENIRVFNFEMGWGYQWLLGKWVALEASGGFTLARSFSGIASEDVNSMDNHVGPNLFSFTGWSSGTLSSNLAFGPSVHIRMGVLLPF